MGLFDKKKKDDFDSPVEEVSLSKPAAKADAKPGGGGGGAPAPQPRTSGQMPAAKPAEAPAAAAAPKPAAPPPKPAPPPEPEYDSDFGINKAIELWRKMPKDNIELVVTVVKTTLEAMNVKVPTIVNDATRKQGDIERRISILKKEIADLEGEIAARTKEIGGLEADHAETTEVKERLILAEKLGEKGKLAPPETPQGKATAQGQGKSG